MHADFTWIAREDSYPIEETDHSGCLFPDGSGLFGIAAPAFFAAIHEAAEAAPRVAAQDCNPDAFAGLPETSPPAPDLGFLAGDDADALWEDEFVDD